MCNSDTQDHDQEHGVVFLPFLKPKVLTYENTDS